MTESANNGDVQACVELGQAYFNGLDHGGTVPRDLAQAARWYSQAARQGQPLAMYMMGVLLKQAQGVARSDTDAADWFLRAAEAGSADAQYNIGVACQRGDGVPRDDMKAAHWFGQAAEQFHVEALRVLGRLYGAGQGVARDPAAALALAMVAAVKAGQRDAKVQTADPAAVEAGKALAERMLASNKVLATLAQWRRSGQRPQHDDGPTRRRSWHAGHSALLSGVLLGLLWVLLPRSTRPSIQAAVLMLAAGSGLYGTYRVSGDSGAPLRTKLICGLLSALPVLGAVVCGLMLYFSMRSRRR